MRDRPESWHGWACQNGELPGALRWQKLAAMPLQSGQVLVRNHAIGLNPVDWKVLETQIGKVPGVDGAGVVVATAADVDECWIGARVAYHQSLKLPGSFAEYTPVSAEALMRIPEKLDYASAAAFPCPALTAWQAIEKVPAQPGARLLIAGAGGGVGQYLTQFAHARGFHVTTISSERHWQRLEALGADSCISGKLASAQPYYAVIDAVSSQQAERLSYLLQANGHLVCIQGRIEQWPCSPFGRALSMHEVALGALHSYGDPQQWRALTQQGERMLAALARGELKGETVLKFPISQLAEQLLALQHRNFSGKQVIEVPTG